MADWQDMEARRIANLEDQVRSLTAKLGIAQHHMDQIANRVLGLEDRAGTAEGNVTSLQGEIDTLERERRAQITDMGFGPLY
jgi:chromosome segregation ATPase